MRPSLVGGDHAGASGIDELMERASIALTETRYFEAERLCLKAMSRAHAGGHFELVSRICLPLQECRRQIRQISFDPRFTKVWNSMPAQASDILPGCHLLEPPVIGVQARDFRALCARREIPVLVLVREPLTRSGRWPIVGVGGIVGLSQFPLSVRVQVPPAQETPPAPEWFAQTQETLGDAAMAKVQSHWPADHRVDDCLELLEAIPDHEKLIQLLAATAREASAKGVSTQRRRRDWNEGRLGA